MDQGGLVLTPSIGKPLKNAIDITFKTTINDVEYETLIRSIRLVKVLDITSLIIKSNFRRVVNYVKDEYEKRRI